MPKFFVPKQDIEADTLCIREDRHHILHVLRQTVGDSLIVCDGEGTDYACTIMEIHDDVLICRIDRREEAFVEPKLRITLCQGLPKAEKMEWILQKCTELGMVRCIPVVTQRSVVRLEDKNKK
jgi:16S rRNA (uracil1498-N3)-methyltransferase